MAPGVDMSRIVFVSDIHIGIDARTNWYSREVHEPMLAAIFDWAAAQGPGVDELVLLGDVVDQWTYVPDARPPSFDEIRAANPGIFADGAGAIARALDALDGRVTWVAGNHDMQVGAAEVATIVGAKGKSPRFVTDFPYLPAAGGGQVACAHGHQFSVFNAPDRQAMPATGVPLGHVVTRLAALWSVQHLPEGKRVVDEAGSGEPTGWPFDKEELRALAVGVVEGKDALPQLVVQGLLDATKQPGSLPITMLDGSTATCAELVKAYGDLYTRWDDREYFPGAGYGLGARFFALMDCDLRSSLAHFAGELGKRGHRVVVFGHTHTAAEAQERPIVGKDSVYANSGFNCPAIPDLENAKAPRLPTFVVVDHDAAAARFTVTVRAVAMIDGQAQVLDAPIATESIGG